MCEECYATENRITPLLNPLECLQNKNKIFSDQLELLLWISKNRKKVCKSMLPVFAIKEYKEFPNIQLRKLTSDEIVKYSSEK